MSSVPETVTPATEALKTPSAEDFRKKVFSDVQNRLPAEQGIADLESRILVALNNQHDNHLGALGFNYNAAFEGAKAITEPTKAEQVKRGLQGVLAETNVYGGKLDLSLPSDTPPEKRAEAIQGKLKEITASLGKKVVEHLTFNLKNERGDLLYEEEKVSPVFDNINISRSQVRKYPLV